MGLRHWLSNILSRGLRNGLDSDGKTGPFREVDALRKAIELAEGRRLFPVPCENGGIVFTDGIPLGEED